VTDSRSSAKTKTSLLPLVIGGIIAAGALLTSWLGALPFRIFVVLLILFAAREMALLISKTGATLPEWGAPVAAALFAVFIQTQRESTPLTVGAGVVLATLVFFVLGILGTRSGRIRSIGATLLIAFYVGMLGSFLVLIRLIDEHGPRLVAALILMVVGYQGARVLGEARSGASLNASLPGAPSYIGLIAGVGGCMLGAFISLLFLHAPFSFPPMAALGLIVAISLVIGELAGLMIRSDSGINDREATLPGSGGLLLWLHPVLLGAPAFFYSFRLYLT